MIELMKIKGFLEDIKRIEKECGVKIPVKISIGLRKEL